MTEYEQNLLIAERVMGWQWQIKQTSHGYWTRTLLPQNQIGEYTPIWDGIVPCDGVDVSHLDYFHPCTESKDALLVKDCMEDVHEFNCSIKYDTYRHPPWEVTVTWHSFGAIGRGFTLAEAMTNAVLSDELKEILEQMWV